MNIDALRSSPVERKNNFMKTIAGFFLVFLSACVWAYHPAEAQQNLAQQAYGIFEQNCLNCHGEHGAFTEESLLSTQHSLKPVRSFQKDQVLPSCIND